MKLTKALKTQLLRFNRYLTKKGNKEKIQTILQSLLDDSLIETDVQKRIAELEVLENSDTEDAMDAAFILALFHEMGFYYPVNMEKANARLERGKAKNHIPSIGRLGHLLFEKDQKKGLELFQVASQGLDEVILYFLALSQTKDIPESMIDKKKLVDLLEQSVAGGDAELEYFASMVYTKFLKEPEYKKRGLELLDRAGKQEYPEALYEMATKWYFGHELERNEDKAFTYFSKLKIEDETRYPYSLFFLGECYFHGRGTPKDLTLAAKHYEMACAHHVPDALYRLAICYRDGCGVEKNHKRCAELLQTLEPCLEKPKDMITINFINACYLLAHCYRLGKLFEKDLKKAHQFLELGAQKGDPRSLEQLGDLYAQGQGVEQDEAQAVKHYRLAAERGSVKAKLVMARCYVKETRVVEQNLRKGIDLYHELAAQGILEAQHELADHYYSKKTMREKYYIVGVRDMKRANLLRLNCIGQGFKVEENSTELKTDHDNLCGLIPKGGFKDIKHAFELLNTWVGDFDKAVKDYLKAKELSQKDKNSPPMLPKQTTTSIQQQILPRILDLIGFCHQLGLGTQTNLKLAEKYYTTSEKIQPSGTDLARLWLLYKQSKGLCVDIGYLKEIASKGVKNNIHEAFVVLAELQETGAGGEPQDLKRAFELYQTACHHPHNAVFNTESDARVHLNKLASLLAVKGLENETAEFQYQVGKILMSLDLKEKAEKNAEKLAFELFSLSAVKHHPQAKCELAKCYIDGKAGKTQDIPHAITLLKASEKESAEAQYLLSIYYREGRFLEKDDTKAMELLKLAAEGNYPEAQYELASCYRQGILIDQDQKQAVDLYRSAASQHHPKAMFEMANFYFQGNQWVTQNILSAHSYYRHLYENGMIEAEFPYALCLEKVNFPNHLESMVTLLKRSAARGNQQAMIKVAQSFYKGQGQKKDLKRAFEWMQMAAQLGNVSAKYFLGWFYCNGDGINSDFSQGIRNFFEAAMAGSLLAQKELAERFTTLGLGLEKDVLRSIILFLNCIEKNHNVAQNRACVTRQLRSKPFAEFQQALKDLKTLPSLLKQEQNALDQWPKSTAEFVEGCKVLCDFDLFCQEEGLDEEDPKTLAEIENLGKKGEPNKDPIYKKQALEMLGFCFQLGIGTQQNLRLALQCYKYYIHQYIDCCDSTTAEQIIQSMSLCYEVGQGSFDINELVNDLEKLRAVGKGFLYEQALSTLAEFYYKGNKGLKANPHKALLYYQELAAIEKHPSPKTEEKREELDIFCKRMEHMDGIHFSWSNGEGRGFPQAMQILIAEYAMDAIDNQPSEENAENATPTRTLSS